MKEDYYEDIRFIGTWTLMFIITGTVFFSLVIPFIKI